MEKQVSEVCMHRYITYQPTTSAAPYILSFPAFVSTDDMDFFLNTTEITIPAGPIPSTGDDCVLVLIVDDDLVEGDHDFDIIITATNHDHVRIGPGSSTTVTIVDNDGMYNTLEMFGLGLKRSTCYRDGWHWI